MSGTGIAISRMQQSYPKSEYLALDYSPKMLAQVPKGIETIEASVTKIPLSTASIDRIVLRNAFYDVPHASQPGTLEELRRILTADGIVVLQTYVTEPETHEALNMLVNEKDKVAGHYDPELPRYFALEEELLEWCRQAGFDVEVVRRFQGRMDYWLMGEMHEGPAREWARKAEALPVEIKQQIQLRGRGLMVQFEFPGMMLRLKPRPVSTSWELPDEGELGKLE